MKKNCLWLLYGDNPGITFEIPKMFNSKNSAVHVTILEMAKIDKKALLPKAFLSIRVEYQSCTLDQNASKIILPTNALTTVTSCQSGVLLKMAIFFEKLPEPVISAQRALSVMYCNDIRSILMSFMKIFPLSLFIGGN